MEVGRLWACGGLGAVTRRDWGCYSEEIHVSDIPKPFRRALLSFPKAGDASGSEIRLISASCFAGSMA